MPIGGSFRGRDDGDVYAGFDFKAPFDLGTPTLSNPPTENEIHKINRYTCRQMLAEADKHLDFVEAMLKASVARKNPDFKNKMVKGDLALLQQVKTARRYTNSVCAKMNY